jgi:hypothetical protein
MSRLVLTPRRRELLRDLDALIGQRLWLRAHSTTVGAVEVRVCDDDGGSSLIGGYSGPITVWPLVAAGYVAVGSLEVVPDSLWDAYTAWMGRYRAWIARNPYGYQSRYHRDIEPSPGRPTYQRRGRPIWITAAGRAALIAHRNGDPS